MSVSRGGDVVTWEIGLPGVVVLPSGRTVRGRALRRPPPPGPAPDFAVYLLGREPRAVPRPYAWIRWRDLGLPRDEVSARAALHDAWARSAQERVEIACRGGRGRTGTALACLAVIDGARPADAVRHVRQHYDRWAVETPWQRRFVERFGGDTGP